MGQVTGILICILFGILAFINIKVALLSRDKQQQKTERDYWYESPHYFVYDDGTKVNMSEYLTYEQYKNMDKSAICIFFLQLENRLKKTTNSSINI